jgi:hypothetical protein
MQPLVGFPLGTIYPITNITQAFPGVVTLSSVALPYSFPIELGMTVTVSGVKGMLKVNDNRYIVANFDSNAMTFSLYDLKFNPVNTTSFQPYVSGGQINIISYVSPPAQPPGLMYNNQQVPNGIQ